MRALLLLLSMAAAAACQQASFKVDVNLVNVAFTVRDSTGALAANLTRDDFEVFEDGVRQKISFLRLASDFTGSAEELMRGLTRAERRDLDFPEIGPRESRQAGTAFYDALYHTATELLSNTTMRRRALIVFSDGEDNSSAHHMLDAIEAAQNADAGVYAIRYTPRGRLNARNKYGIGVMARIGRETGGADFDAAQADLRAAFRQIGEELRASYELAYTATNPERDGLFRKVVIRSKRPGLTVRAKTGYIAR